MEKNEKIYIALQRHIDSQAIGFPATIKGSELRILKHIFSPKEAEIATCLTYKLEPLETVFGPKKFMGGFMQGIPVRRESLND